MYQPPIHPAGSAWNRARASAPSVSSSPTLYLDHSRSARLICSTASMSASSVTMSASAPRTAVGIGSARVLMVQAHVKNSANLPEVSVLLSRAAALGFKVQSTCRSGGYSDEDVLWTLQADNFSWTDGDVQELQQLCQEQTSSEIKVFCA